MRLLLVSGDGEWTASTMARLTEVSDLQTDLLAGPVEDMGSLFHRGADVVLLDVDGADDASLRDLAGVTRDPSTPPVLLLSRGPDVDLYKRATRAGARAVLDKEEPLQELMEAVYLASSERTPPPDDSQTQTEAPASPDDPEAIVVFGLRGGSGRTSLAVNLALALERRRGNVALVDLNFAFGAASLMLNHVPEHSFSDLLGDVARLDPDLLSGYMGEHESGLHILPCPTRPETAEYVTPDHVRAILETALECYGTVVVDAPGTFDGVLFNALDVSTRLLLVTTGDLAAVRNTRAALSVLDTVHFPRSKLSLVLSGAGCPHHIRPKDIAETLGVAFWGQVPWDEAATTTAINRGVPVYLGRPRSAYAQAVAQFASRLDDERRHGRGAAKRARPRSESPAGPKKGRATDVHSSSS